MKVLFIPPHKDPYQQSLSRHLQDYGVRVIFGRRVSYFSCVEVSLLYNLIKHYPFKILHLHWQHPFLLAESRTLSFFKSLFFIVQLLLVKCIGIKIVWTVHNIVNHEKIFPQQEIFFSRIIAWIASSIIVHCQAAKRTAISAFKIRNVKKVRIIQHGSFVGRFENRGSKQTARKRLKIPMRCRTYLFFGLIRPYKGILELIDCFKTVCHGPGYLLLIAGKIPDNELAKTIVQKIQNIDNIRFVPGHVPDHAVQHYMNASDFIVYPYRDILTSGGVISAASFGKAIIAPRIGCIPEILDARSGYLYEKNNPDGLCNALRQTKGLCAEKIASMGEYNYNVVKQLSWHSISESTFRLYAHL